MNSRLRIIVTGLIAQHPTLGGVTWDYLQYALGLARLGHEVYYFEDSGEWPYNLDGGSSGNDWIAQDPAPNVGHLASVMSRFGLADKWAYRFPTTERWFGLSGARRRAVLDSADLLVNVSGTLEHPERYRQIGRLAYIDSDPLFTQIKLVGADAEFRRRVDVHDVHFSFGEALSDGVPRTGHRWIPTRHPMVLEEWRPVTPRRDRFTTVMNWTSYEPLAFAGRAYGQKDVEFRRFLSLPSLVAPTKLEIALAKTQHANWETGANAWPATVREFVRGNAAATPAQVLAHCGWRVADPAEVCHDLDSYRAYLRTSMAEWSVAKHGYVQGRTGWFSCRSSCYLASGRPVVVQNTGFGDVLPVGQGILPFDTIEEAANALREVAGNYEVHCRAATEIAREYFDSQKVLARLTELAMNTESEPRPTEATA